MTAPRKARQGSTSSSRMGTRSSKRPRSSAASTGSTRSTGRSARIPGAEERPMRPKRRRVDSRAVENRDAYMDPHARVGEVYHSSEFADVPQRPFRHLEQLARGERRHRVRHDFREVDRTIEVPSGASVNRPGIRWYPAENKHFMRDHIYTNDSFQTMYPPGMLQKRHSLAEGGLFGEPPTHSDETNVHADGWYGQYGSRLDPPGKSWFADRDFIRDFARYRMRPYRPGGPAWHEARDSWLANGGGSRPEPGLGGRPVRRPPQRARKPARPVRRARG